MAESFGADAERYDRVRPSYPAAVVDAIVAQAPGGDVLDVGCGTGIAARLVQQAGCAVVGVEPDARMAAFARERGLEVEVARFEEWESAGRMFDAVISATSWHWIDPPVGALRAAQVLRPGGLLAVFWNVQHPPASVAAAFGEVYGRIAPGSPFARQGSEPHARMRNRAERGVIDSGAFDTPRTRRFRWEQTYGREQWLDLTATFGGYDQLSDEQRSELHTGLGDAIDAVGGAFTMTYETLLLSAVRA